MDRWTPDKLTVHPENPPNRRLILRGELTHGYSGSLTNVHPFLEIWIAGIHVYQAEAQGWRSTKGHEGVVEAHGTIQIEASVVLPSAILAAIEKRRAGGDVEILIQGRIRSSIAHREQSGGHFYAGETRFHHIRTGDGQNWRHPIGRSEWLKILDQLGWQITELLEIPLPLEGSNDALNHLKDARAQLALGHFPEVLGLCYKALEAALPEPRKFKDRNAPQLTSKAHEALDLVIRNTKDVLHEGRHHRSGVPDVGAADARMAVLVTAGLIQFLQ